MRRSNRRTRPYGGGASDQAVGPSGSALQATAGVVRSAPKCGGEALERATHGLTISLGTVIHTRDLFAVLVDGLRPQILAPLGHTASRRSRLDPISPRREVKVMLRALKGERPARAGLDDLALRCPLVLAVAVVAIESGSYHRAVETIVPLAGIAFLGPFTHAGNVRDGGIHQFGRSADVPGYFDSVGHGRSSPLAPHRRRAGRLEATLGSLDPRPPPRSS